MYTAVTVTTIPSPLPLLRGLSDIQRGQSNFHFFEAAVVLKNKEITKYDCKILVCFKHLHITN